MRLIGTLMLSLLSLLSFAQEKIISIKPQSGVRDYTQRFQQAIDELIKSNGGKILIQPGNYTVSNHIIVFSLAARNTPLNIEVIGVPGKNAVLPIIQTNNITKPHMFFSVKGDGERPMLGFTVKNLVFKGKNQPFSSNALFYQKHMEPTPGIKCINVAAAHFENVTIQDVYGDGINIANYGDRKNQRVQRPSIKNVKILNCWSWNGKDDGGDGIMLWFADRPVVQNCKIINEVNKTNSYSRAGIVLEKETEAAIISDNVISGYQRNIHVEFTYGGHQITNNVFDGSSIGITFQEQSWDKSNATDFKKTVVSNNTFNYNPTTEKAGINRPFKDWSFISGNLSGNKIQPIEVKNNVFNYNTGGKITVNKSPDGVDNVFIYFRHLNGYNKGYINSNNKFNVK